MSVRVAQSAVDSCRRVSPSAVDMYSMKDQENQCEMLTTENVSHILQACYKKLELAFNTFCLYITSWTSFGYTLSGSVWFMLVQFSFFILY